MYRASVDNLIVPQLYKLNAYPSSGTSKIRGSYHTSFRPILFGGINIRPINESDYSKVEPPVSGKYTPLPVAVHF
jgi:hypothetical protein